jgi:hypothetical protein
MPFSASDLKAGTRASYPTFEDPSTVNYGALTRLHAADPVGGMNHFLTELQATQDFAMDWGTNVANVEHYARARGLGASDDCTLAVRDAIASGRHLIYFPRVFEITDTIYQPFGTVFVANLGFKGPPDRGGGLKAKTAMLNIPLVQIGGGRGMFGMRLDCTAGSRKHVLFKADLAQDPNAESYPGYGYATLDGMLAHCYFWKGLGGLLVQEDVGGFHFHNNTFDGGQCYCLWVDSANGGIFDNNQLTANRFFLGNPLPGNGPHTNVKLERAYNNVWVGNEIDANPEGTGLTMTNSTGNLFGSTLIQCCNKGIEITGCPGSDFESYGQSWNHLGDVTLGHMNEESVVVDSSSLVAFGTLQFGGTESANIAQVGDPPAFKTVGTCERVHVQRILHAPNSWHTKTVELSAGTTKSGVETLIAPAGVTAFTNNGGGTNFNGRLVQ